MKHSNNGFTILEITIVVAIVVAISLLTSINLESFRRSSLIGETSREVIGIFELAKSRSVAGDGGVAYKVHFTPSAYQLLTETGEQKSRTVIDGSIEIVPPASDIIFYRVTGKSNGGSVTIRHKSGNPQKTITVSTLGLVSESGQ